MTAIRPATILDLPGVYRVCLETGDSGEDGTALYRNPELLGHVYAGPYVLGQPDYAFVVADERGVGGYVLAAADTRAFEDWAERNWWPALREQYPSASGDSPDAKLIGLLHSPHRAPDELLVDYPAHLHIDLLPRLQGRGHGRALIDLVVGRLREQGVRGIHLVAATDNRNAIAFYAHLGFQTLSTGPEGEVMGMRLA